MSWKEKELVDIIDFYNNQRVPLSGIKRSKIQGIYPYHGAQGIVDYINKYIFDGKYILVAEDGENLRSRNQDIARFANGKFWVNNHAHIIRGKSGICDDYFLKVMLNLIDIGGYVTGAAQPKLSMTNLKRIKIQLPPLPTQKRIADILSAYDDLIENNLKRIKLLEQAAQNIYKEWFVHLRFPGYENTPINEETGLPQGWEVNPFSDVADFINGYAFKPKHHSKTGLPIIKIKELKNGIKDDTPRNSGEDVPEKYHFGDNTILFSWSASLDVYWWYGGESLLNQHLFKVEPNVGLNKWHFFYGLKGAVEEFRSRANGATMKHIKRSELATVFYTNPTNNIAKDFQVHIRPILQQVLVLNKQNQKLKEARDILLPRLMNRTIEV